MGDNRVLASLSAVAYAYSRIRHTDDAKRLFDVIDEVARNREIGDGSSASAYLAIGREQRALQHLEIVAEKVRNQEPDQGFFNLMDLRMNITKDPLREDPRFKEVLGRVSTLD